jgi:hypothetical protein
VSSEAELFISTISLSEAAVSAELLWESLLLLYFAVKVLPSAVEIQELRSLIFPRILVASSPSAGVG